MEHIIVGKHTLESLTSGMYADPFVVYREYIQNAVDSLDSCIEAGRIESEEAKVNITVSSIERKITISDNGIGMTEEEMENNIMDDILLDSSNSNSELFDLIDSMYEKEGK